MRTTITFERDTAVAVDELRRLRGIGVSAAVNELVRAGLRNLGQTCPAPFVQRTSPGHARVDVTDVAATLDLLDDRDAGT